MNGSCPAGEGASAAGADVAMWVATGDRGESAEAPERSTCEKSQLESGWLPLSISLSSSSVTAGICERSKSASRRKSAPDGTNSPENSNVHGMSHSAGSWSNGVGARTGAGAGASSALLRERYSGAMGKVAPGERHGESPTIDGSPYEAPHGVTGVNGPAKGDVGEMVSVGDTICPAPPYVCTGAPFQPTGMKVGMGWRAR